ncbi:hypothetical protein BH23GEM6_BH23GEM6_27830 [soil metagenome]
MRVNAFPTAASPSTPSSAPRPAHLPAAPLSARSPPQHDLAFDGGLVEQSPALENAEQAALDGTLKAVDMVAD